MILPKRIQQKYKARIATFSNERLLQLQEQYKMKIKEIEDKYPYFRKKKYKDILPPLSDIALHTEYKTYLNIITGEIWKREHEWNIQ